MISEREALAIAHEYTKGSILKQSWNAKMGYDSKYPKSWIFSIYHRNEDNDTFQTIIEVTNTGVVSDWQTKYISDEVK